MQDQLDYHDQQREAGRAMAEVAAAGVAMVDQLLTLGRLAGALRAGLIPDSISFDR